MRLQKFSVSGRSSCSPETLFDILAASEEWPQWSPVEKARVTRPGRDHPDGIGSIREFRTGRRTIVEEIVEFNRPERISYIVKEGIAVRGYKATISLMPAEFGTEIKWETSFTAKIPGMSGLYRRGLERLTRRFVDALTRFAKR